MAASRIAAADGLTDPQAHALAGLIDAEGSFAIVPNNGGRTWRCAMTVAIRRDDARLLMRYQRLTGLGTLVAQPARTPSKPQAVWSVQSGLECMHLAQLLEEFRLRGRKRLEADIWIDAVRAQEDQRPRVADLSDFARQLNEARRYVEPSAELACPGRDEPGLLWYFGGFFTGDGSFRLSRKEAKTVIQLRRDDRPLLLAFARLTGLGRVYDCAPRGTARPTARWVIHARDHLVEAIELLRAARLQGRKHREFQVWRVGAEEFIDARDARRPRSESTVDLAIAGLRELRSYVDVAIPEQDSRLDQQVAYVSVLQEFGRLVDGAATVTRYAELSRNRTGWPAPRTVLGAFGSWFEALEAAGLANRAHPRSARPASLAG